MKSLQSLRQRAQRGFTLVELLIVIGIGAVIIAVGLTRAIEARQLNKASDELSDLQTIANETRKVYANQANFTGVTMTTLARLRVFPTNRIQDAGTGNVVNAFGATWAAAPVNVNSTDDGITFTAAGYPRKVCVDLVTSAADTFARILVNATEVKALGGAVNVATLGTQCDTSNNNTIAFTVAKN
jgi:prepilin-type N-terminal cleavage/methylation domain-containing protein